MCEGFVQQATHKAIELHLLSEFACADDPEFPSGLGDCAGHTCVVLVVYLLHPELGYWVLVGQYGEFLSIIVDLQSFNCSTVQTNDAV